MASNKEYFDYISEQLNETDEIAFRKMMGEYILYCKGKVIGGIYDDRLLIKPTRSAKEPMPDAVSELPYEGAKEMLLVDNLDDKEFLKRLTEAVADDLPEPKKKKRTAK